LVLKHGKCDKSPKKRKIRGQKKDVKSNSLNERGRRKRGGEERKERGTIITVQSMKFSNAQE